MFGKTYKPKVFAAISKLSAEENDVRTTMQSLEKRYKQFKEICVVS